MMKNLISAAALTVALAAPSVAATLNGTFTIDIRNFSDTAGNDTIVTDDNSGATAGNFDAQISDAVISYTGAINFGIGSGNSESTSIWDFLSSAGGTINAGAAEAFLKDTRLSFGTYVTTTFFKFTGAFARDVEGVITHDDGITLAAVNGQTGGVSAPPTSKLLTDFTAEGGAFSLIYASANGNPSILSIDVVPVPLPAGGLLLLGALGGIAALRRRKAV